MFKTRSMFFFVIIFSYLVAFSNLNVQGAAGDLDSTFGNGGKVVFRFSDGEDSFKAVTVQPDNKIVVAGKNGSGRLIVIRYNTDGSLDTSFATAGILTLSSISSALCEAIALQNDGKIIIVGLVSLGGNNNAYLVIRVNTNGTLDNTFGNNGVVVTNLTEGNDIGRDIAVQTDGKLVVTGSVRSITLNNGDIGVVRYNTDGSLDTTFDSDGIVITPIANNSEQGYAVKVQTDGKIVVSASSDNLELQKFYHALVRYMPDGSLDAGFGNRGIALTDLGTSYFQFGDVALQNDGKIIVLGSIGNNSEFVYDFTVLRFLTNGLPDTNFGTSGKTIITSGNTNSAQALEIQPNGKILAVGHDWVTGSGLDILVSRLNQDGSFDTSFGNNGKVFTKIGGTLASEYGWDAALQKDGKLVVVGDFNLSLFDYDAVVLRYLGASPVQKNKIFDFDGDGKTDIAIWRFSVGEWWYLRSSDGESRAFKFGENKDYIVPADYTGDGKTDIAFWRELTGEWFILRSEDSSFYSFPFGSLGDVAAPADFDGDGKADPAVWRPSTATWYILRSTGGVSIQKFGASNDTLVPTDYDGDGRADLAIYRHAVGEWWYLRSSDGESRAFQFGGESDRPVPLDYTGDGKTDIAFWRPRTGEWFILRSEDGSYYSAPFGRMGDIQAPGDYDGDGRADLAVWRPTDGNWYIVKSSGGFSIAPFGTAGDKPIPAVYVP